MTTTEPEQVEPEEFNYTIDEDFIRLQSNGKCGELQESGSRCKSPVVEWFDLDPDRPHPQGPRVGACGTHIRMVGPRVKQTQRRVYDRRVRDYVKEEARRVVRVLRLAGLKLKLNDGLDTMSAYIENPAELLYTLGEFGILDQLGIDVTSVKQCSSEGDRHGRKFPCMEADGHYPGTKHFDWDRFYWDDPKPVEPEPPKEPEVSSQGEGGQLS